MILDGHHRKNVLETLKWKSVECQIWTVSEEDAQLALVTLNRLRGADNLRKRAELIHSLTQTLEIQALASLIPESPPEIETLLSSLQFDFQQMEAAIQSMQQPNKGAALAVLCRKVMNRHE